MIQRENFSRRKISFKTELNKIGPAVNIYSSPDFIACYLYSDMLLPMV